MAEPVKHEKEILAVRRADGESRSLAASLPRLVLEACRIAAYQWSFDPSKDKDGKPVKDVIPFKIGFS